jgi:hypothetical protein
MTDELRELRDTLAIEITRELFRNVGPDLMLSELQPKALARVYELADVVLSRRDRKPQLTSGDCDKWKKIPDGHGNFHCPTCLAGIDDPRCAHAAETIEHPGIGVVQTWYPADRCQVCGWPLSGVPELGCTSTSCSYRPRKGTEDYHHIKSRREWLAKQPSDTWPIYWPLPKAAGK